MSRPDVDGSDIKLRRTLETLGSPFHRSRTSQPREEYTERRTKRSLPRTKVHHGLAAKHLTGRMLLLMGPGRSRRQGLLASRGPRNRPSSDWIRGNVAAVSARAFPRWSDNVISPLTKELLPPTPNRFWADTSRPSEGEVRAHRTRPERP